MLDILIDNAGELVLSVVFILCKIFGRSKSAEKVEQAIQRKKRKRIAKLEKKSAKATDKADKLVNELLAETQTENVNKE